MLKTHLFSRSYFTDKSSFIIIIIVNKCAKTDRENISARRRSNQPESGTGDSRRARGIWCSGRADWGGSTADSGSRWSRTSSSCRRPSLETTTQMDRETRPANTTRPSPAPAFRAPPRRSTGPSHQPDLSTIQFSMRWWLTIANITDNVLNSGKQRKFVIIYIRVLYKDTY